MQSPLYCVDVYNTTAVMRLCITSFCTFERQPSAVHYAYVHKAAFRSASNLFLWDIRPLL